MKLLIDTDVLLDVALNRAPFAGPACLLLDHLQMHPGNGMIAWHSVSNFYYLVRSTRGDSETRAFIADLLTFVHVVSGDTDSVRSALSLPMADFEDALQVVSAQSGKANRIVTRNTADYRQAPLPARSPADTLVELGIG
jgi:predicted nucleic acid-binding protein